MADAVLEYSTGGLGTAVHVLLWGIFARAVVFQHRGLE